MNTRVLGAAPLAAMMTALLAFPGAGEAGQTAYSDRPLKEYCSHAPDFSVQRTDSVDNWVKVCSIWFQFQARCVDYPNTPKAPPKPARP